MDFNQTNESTEEGGSRRSLLSSIYYSCPWLLLAVVSVGLVVYYYWRPRTAKTAIKKAKQNSVLYKIKQGCKYIHVHTVDKRRKSTSSTDAYLKSRHAVSSLPEPVQKAANQDRNPKEVNPNHSSAQNQQPEDDEVKGSTGVSVYKPLSQHLPRNASGQSNTSSMSFKSFRTISSESFLSVPDDIKKYFHENYQNKHKQNEDNLSEGHNRRAIGAFLAHQNQVGAGFDDGHDPDVEGQYVLHDDWQGLESADSGLQSYIL